MPRFGHLVRCTLDDLAARPDIGRDAGNPRRAGFQDDQRLRLADAGQRQDVDLAKIIYDVDLAGEADRVAQPEFVDRRLQSAK